MKLTLTKLGRIEEAELDIRPLTVFIGKNDTNKTWAAYAFYALARARAWQSWFSGDLDAGAVEIQRDAQTLQRLEDLLASSVRALAGTSPINPVSLQIGAGGLVDARSHGRVLAGSLALAGACGVPPAAMSSAVAVLTWDASETESRGGTEPSLTIQGGENLEATLLSNQGSRFSHILNSDAVALEPRLEDFIRKRLGALATADIERVVALPAERKLLSYLSTSPRGQAPLDLALPLAVRDYSRALLGFVARSRFPTALWPDFSGHVAHVSGGRVEINESAGGALEFRPLGSKLQIPIQGATSLARSLAGLSLYLETVCRPGDILVIDEPEMNAHPEAQLAIIELFAVLVNAGIRILFTTHSPYMVDHLTTLMEATRLPAEKRQEVAKSFRLGSADAFLEPEKVAVYEFRETTDRQRVEVIDRIERAEPAIVWKTFSDVSNEVSRHYADVVDAEEEQ